MHAYRLEPLPPDKHGPVGWAMVCGECSIRAELPGKTRDQTDAWAAQFHVGVPPAEPAQMERERL